MTEFAALLTGVHPIEQMFAKLKALLRKAAARSLDLLWDTIGRLLDALRSRRMPKLPQKLRLCPTHAGCALSVRF